MSNDPGKLNADTICKIEEKSPWTKTKQQFPGIFMFVLYSSDPEKVQPCS